MDMENDLTLLRYLLRKIYHAETRMKKLKSWMLFDFFSDSFILNWFKRRQISELNKDLAEIQRGLKILQRDYPYLLANSNLHISNSTWDYIFDLWLDNVVVDFMIFKNVQEISRNLDTLKVVVVRLIKQQLN
ncbi:MAG: hypothetical protein HXK75_00550 [Granulicatella sp.]|nr:hypothetical protein [Granulicatella sp.]